MISDSGRAASRKAAAVKRLATCNESERKAALEELALADAALRRLGKGKLANWRKSTNPSVAQRESLALRIVAERAALVVEASREALGAWARGEDYDDCSEYLVDLISELDIALASDELDR